MRLYVRSRRLLFTISFIIIFEVLCTFFAKAIRMPNDAAVIEAALTVPLQIIPVWVGALSLRSEMEGFEIAGARSPMKMRLVTVTTLTGTLLITSLVHCLLSFSHWGEHHWGSVGLFGAFRAALGLWGATLVVATFVDARLAAVVCFVPIAMAMIADPTVGNAQLLGFIFATAESEIAWSAAILLMCVGVLSYVLGYDFTRSRKPARRTV